jgi:hypothetical protein
MWSDTESEKDYLNFGEVSQLAVDILTADSMLPITDGTICYSCMGAISTQHYAIDILMK